MGSRRVTEILVLAIAVTLGAWLVRYFSAEQVIRRQVRDAIESFENEQLLGVATVLSRSYHDPWGMSYEAVLGHVQEVMDTLRLIASIMRTSAGTFSPKDTEKIKVA